MSKVAWIGLGVMGYPMAGHIREKGGHDLTVYNRTAAKAKKWVRAIWRQCRGDTGRSGRRSRFRLLLRRQ